MLRPLPLTYILVLLNRSTGVHFFVRADSSYTDFGDDNGWCFGAENHYAGIISTAEVTRSITMQK
jgi:hypothetical protein